MPTIPPATSRTIFPASDPTETSERAHRASNAARAHSFDRFERAPTRRLSRVKGEALNQALFTSLRSAVESDTPSVSGIHWVEPAAFMGYTHQLPGLRLEFDKDVNEAAVLGQLQDAFPDLERYTTVKEWKTWDWLPAWFPFVERRTVMTFRLDTNP